MTAAAIISQLTATAVDNNWNLKIERTDTASGTWYAVAIHRPDIALVIAGGVAADGALSEWSADHRSRGEDRMPLETLEDIEHLLVRAE